MNLKFFLAHVYFVEVTLRYFIILFLIFLIIICTFFFFMIKILITRNYDVLGLC